MKKGLLLILLMTSTLLASAQFFTPTTYRGAVSPDSTQDWTREAWVNWNPQTTNYPVTTVDVNPGDITTNTTWTSNNVYRLNGGFIYVTNGATLTIQPGTIIRGEGKGTLIICRGARIVAQGTASQPIVFTSNAPAGSRQPGNWGGIVITGRATHNLLAGDTAAAEGGIAKALPSGDGRYGGNDDNDNSGVLSYVRLEYPGIPLTTASNSEINGLTLCAVGSGTQLDHIQVSYSGDDAYEWFGGTVNGKYLIALGTWDDDFDTDNGYRGLNQFGIALRDPKIADQSGSNGFESDNDAQGSNRLPRTEAVFCNFSFIGPRFSGAPVINSNFRRAAHIRRGSAMSAFNSILTGWTESGIMLENRRTVAQASLENLMLRNLIVAGSGRRNARLTSSASDTAGIDSANFYNWFFTQGYGNDTLLNTEAIQLYRPAPWDTLANSLAIRPNLSPRPGSIAASGANFNYTKLGFFPASVSGLNLEGLAVYPNPAKGTAMVTFEMPEAAEFQIRVIDLSGRALQVQRYGKLLAGEQVLPLSLEGLRPGLYLLQLEAGQASGTMKIVVE